MIYLLLAPLSKPKRGLAISFTNELEFGSSTQKSKNAEVIPRIDKIEVFASRNGSQLGNDDDLDQEAALNAAHALLSTQPLLWNEQKHGPLCADIYLECDKNTQIKGNSGGLAYSLRLLEELTAYDPDDSQRFNDTHTTMLQLVIGATGEIDQIGQISRVEDVAIKLEAFVVKLQKDWPEIQTATGEAYPRIVFLLPEENLAELDSQILNQAKEKLYTLSPNVDIVGIERLSTAIQTLVGDRFPVVGLQHPPYKGLNSFDPQDRFLFYGRGDEVTTIRNNMEEYRRKETAHRHCIVYGDSGVGKSSFVKAGMLPILSPQTHSTLQNWVILKPGDGQGQLLDHFIDSLRPIINPSDQKSLLNLPWRKNPDKAVSGFADLYISVRADLKAPASFVLVIDQAEELLRMPEAGNEINQFKVILQAFSNYHHSNLNTRPLEFQFWLISTIRKADFENYLSLLAFKNEKAQFLGYRLDALNPSKDIASYQAIIENPARLRGIYVEPELTQHLLSVITEFINPLPTLEYTLDELYQYAVKTQTLKKGLTLAAFKNERIIGSMSGLITRNAQALLDELKKDSGIRTQIPVFFSLLLGVDKIHGLAYSNPTKTEVFKKSADLYHLYQAFVDHRFLFESYKYENDNDESDIDNYVRFSHEVLIREWSEVQAWAKETVQRQQKRKIRNLLVGLVLSIGLIFIASYAAYYADQQSDIAKQERDRAEEKEVFANRQALIAKTERDKALIVKSRFLADLSCKYTENGNARLGALLALEALPDYSQKVDKRRPYVAEAEWCLNAILNQYMDLLWLRHESSVSFATFSLYGRQIVTASSNNTARVWDSETGQELIVLKSYGGGRYNVAFSLDGMKIGTGFGDGSVDVWDSDTGLTMARLEGHSSTIKYAAFSPDRKKILTAFNSHLFVDVWNAETGQFVAMLKGHTSKVKFAAFSLDGKKVVTVSMDGSSRVWDSETGKLMALLKGDTSRVNHAAFRPDGKKVVTVSTNGSARVLDSETGKVVAILDGHTEKINFATFSLDGEKILTASNDKTARVWNSETGKKETVMTGHSGKIKHATYSPNQDRIVTASSDNTVRVWNSKTGQVLAILNVHTAEVNYATFSPDGKKIATASKDKTVRLWDNKIDRSVIVLNASSSSLTHATFSPDGTKIVTASGDNAARVWDGKTGQELAILKGHTAAVNYATFSPDGKKIVTASHKTARVWDSDTGQILKVLSGHTGLVHHASFSPDGKMIVTASSDNTVRVWNSETGRAITELKVHFDGAHYVAFSPDGKKIVTSSSDKAVHVWDSKTGQVLAILKGHTKGVNHAIFSPDGKKIVTASYDTTARLWDSESGQVLAILKGHTEGVFHAAFSPDGKKVVTGSGDKTARVWDSETGQIIAVSRHSDSVIDVGFSPDGKKFFTISWDTVVSVWDVETGKITAVLSGHTGYIVSVYFSADGRKIVTASNDGTARIWDVYSTKELVARVKSLGLPPLTPEERLQNYLD